MGIANASAALDSGARVLDGSLGGLGGCPFAPGATGNVVFEDLAFLCESKGFATGIDIEKLIAVRGILKSEMPGEALYGGLARAGLPGGTAARRRNGALSLRVRWAPSPLRGRERAPRKGRTVRRIKACSLVITSRSALPTTLTDDSAMAAAAMIGESRIPRLG
jgi:hypothetical protein